MQFSQPVLTEDEMLLMLEMAGYQIETWFIQEHGMYKTVLTKDDKEFFKVLLPTEHFSDHMIPTVFGAYVRIHTNAS